jgi:hypothetical protein
MSSKIGDKQMSEWVTDRAPTAEDANEAGFVIVSDPSFEKGLLFCWYKAIYGRPWMSPPKPYQPPNSKRREWGTQLTPHGYSAGCLWDDRQPHHIHVREVFPGDPDPEAVLEVASQLESLAADTDWMLTDQDLRSMAAKLRGEDD